MGTEERRYPPISAVTTGLAGRCPRCGDGRLFSGFLTVAPKCEVCGLDFSFADSGDGPAVFVTLIAGFLVLGAALAVEMAYEPPLWVYAVVFLPLTLVVCLGLLRPLEGPPDRLAIQQQGRAGAAGGTVTAAGVSGRRRSLVAPAPSQPWSAWRSWSSLGVWQLQRLAWKEALIAAVDARVHAAPVDPPAPEADGRGLNPSDYEYRHVRVSGVYDLKRQALVFRALPSPRGRYGGPGYLVMTPLKLADGASVLVNRGFVPEEQKAAAEHGPARRDGRHRAACAPARARTWFTPADDPARGQWFTRDVEAIARRSMGLARTRRSRSTPTPAPIRLTLPEGGETILAFPNNHLSYAIDLVRHGAGAGGGVRGVCDFARRGNGE